MLASRHRLRRSRDFTTAFRAGHRARRATLVVHVQAGASDHPPRAGFAVSRAVGSAVTRNRVRRRLRHLVRPYLNGLPAGTVLVVRALPAAAHAPPARLAEDLAEALAAAAGRAGVRGGDRP